MKYINGFVICELVASRSIALFMKQHVMKHVELYIAEDLFGPDGSVLTVQLSACVSLRTLSVCSAHDNIYTLFIYRYV